jgi:hypothetical protein
MRHSQKKHENHGEPNNGMHPTANSVAFNLNHPARRVMPGVRRQNRKGEEGHVKLESESRQIISAAEFQSWLPPNNSFNRTRNQQVFYLSH